jgi:hypothetical protein
VGARLEFEGTKSPNNAAGPATVLARREFAQNFPIVDATPYPTAPMMTTM